jgi:phosphoglycerate dehydrogenase-like enzyme
MATTARTDELGAVHAVSELAELLPEADVVLLAVPLTPATTRLVDAGFLSSMKPGALLVNVSRGAVVDTDALVASARDGRVRAALDVTDPEPLPADHPLWTTPGILISPHVGGDSTAMAPRMERLIREQAVRLVRGEEPLNVVLRT